MSFKLDGRQGVSRVSSLIVVLWMVAQTAGAWAQTDVWIDPGHGGGDNGNPGYDGIATHQEKFVNLLQSESLYNRLGQIGYTSLLTRNSDNNYPTLSQRSLMAVGELENDLQEQEVGQMLVSIHMNSPKVATNAAPFGTETFYSPVKVFAHRLDTYKVDSTFAAVIHANLMTGAAAAFLGCNSNRGVKLARHVVTREARVPAVLIEVCFLTNQCQQTNILQAGDRALIANGIAAGISNVIVPGGLPAYRLPPGPPAWVMATTEAQLLVSSSLAAWPANAAGSLALNEGIRRRGIPSGWVEPDDARASCSAPLAPCHRGPLRP